MNSIPPFLFGSGRRGGSRQPFFPRQGNGARVTVNRLGAAYTAPQSGQSFLHPWYPTLAGSGLTLSRGSVQMPANVAPTTGENATGIYEPTINGVPISGDGQPSPILPLSAAMATAAGESWACLQILLDAQAPAGNAATLSPGTTPTIIHSNSPVSTDPNTALMALVMILWSNQQPVQAIEGVYFNVTYTRIVPAPGGGPVQHLFF